MCVVVYQLFGYIPYQAYSFEYKSVYVTSFFKSLIKEQIWLLPKANDSFITHHIQLCSYLHHIINLLPLQQPKCNYTIKWITLNDEKSLWYLNIKWLEGAQWFDWCYIKLDPSTVIFMQRCVWPVSQRQQDAYFPSLSTPLLLAICKMLTIVNESNKEWKRPFKCRLWLTFEGIWVCFSAWLQAGLILSGRANHGTACTNCALFLILSYESQAFCNTEMSHILNPCYNYAVEIMHADGMRCDKLKKITRNWKLL